MYVARLKLANESAPEACAKMLQECIVREYKDDEDEEEDPRLSSVRFVLFISKPCPTSMAQFTWLFAFHVVLLAIPPLFASHGGFVKSHILEKFQSPWGSTTAFAPLSRAVKDCCNRKETASITTKCLNPKVMECIRSAILATAILFINNQILHKNQKK